MNTAIIVAHIDADSGQLGNLTIDGGLTITSGGTLTAGNAQLNTTGLKVTTAAGDITADAGGISIPAGSESSGARVKINGISIHSVTGSALRIVNADGSNASLSVKGNIITTDGGDIQANGRFLVVGAIEDPNIAVDTGTPVVWHAVSAQYRKESSSIRYKRNIRKWQPQF